MFSHPQHPSTHNTHGSSRNRPPNPSRLRLCGYSCSGFGTCALICLKPAYRACGHLEEHNTHKHTIHTGFLARYSSIVLDGIPAFLALSTMSLVPLLWLIFVWKASTMSGRPWSSICWFRMGPAVRPCLFQSAGYTSTWRPNSFAMMPANVSAPLAPP